jgi:hypothetical protein
MIPFAFAGATGWVLSIWGSHDFLADITTPIGEILHVVYFYILLCFVALVYRKIRQQNLGSACAENQVKGREAGMRVVQVETTEDLHTALTDRHLLKELLDQCDAPYNLTEDYKRFIVEFFIGLGDIFTVENLKRTTG